MQKILITFGQNGSPKNVQEGYLFDNFSEIEDWTDDISVFRKRDGWNFWEKIGRTTSPLTVNDYLTDLGDDFQSVGKEEFEYLPYLFGDCETFERAHEILKEKLELFDKLEQTGKNQIVIMCNGAYFDTVDNKMLSYHEDVWTYAIGKYDSTVMIK